MERSNLCEILERNAEIAFQRENEAWRRLSDAEAHLESRDWARRESEFLWMRVNCSLNLHERFTAGRSMGWSRSIRKDEFVWKTRYRNRIYYEHQVRTNEEVEELRRIFYVEASQVRRLQTKGLTLRQEKYPNTVSELLKQTREKQDQVNSLSEEKRISRSWCSEQQLRGMARSRTTSSCSECQRNAWPRFWIADCLTE